MHGKRHSEGDESDDVCHSTCIALPQKIRSVMHSTHTPIEALGEDYQARASRHRILDNPLWGDHFLVLALTDRGCGDGGGCGWEGGRGCRDSS